ncbi:MAG: polysaccharide biosynthesis protein [Gammaproteobacteria bacterium]
MNRIIKSKKILITGSCGSIGKKLIDALLDNENNAPSLILGLDNSENGIFIQDQKYHDNDKVHFRLCDIREKSQLAEYFKDIDIVFHLAALKHVAVCEKSPQQAIMTNIRGIQNIIDVSKENNVSRVIFTSSDKAVNPTNVMGASKLMGERLITAANHASSSKTIFASIRFGNVLGSNGSVIPIFFNQIKKNTAITLTSKEMTRFVMTIKNAVDLILESTSLAKGGEIFICKMPVLNINELAQAMILKFSPNKKNPIKIIGSKPGEKEYEELMTSEECRRTIELKDMLCITPALKSMYHKVNFKYPNQVKAPARKPYISSEEKRLSKKEILSLLDIDDLFDNLNDHQTERYWPGD